MTLTSAPPSVLAAAAAVAAGLLLAATACSSADDAASPSVAVVSTSPASPTSAVPATSAAPPTTSTSPTTSAADPARRALLSAILDSHHAAGEFVGARIALLDHDGSITEVASGTATVDTASGPVDPDVAWNIGSVTKLFVAVVVLQLAEEGLIDLDAGIDGFVPGLAGAERITPRHLLQHTSGLAEYLSQPVVIADMQREWTAAELIAVADAAGRVGEPGGPYHYSNTNYVVLGELIEQVTGNTWADEVRTRIAEPLDLTSTGAITDEKPPGYQLVNGSFVDATSSAHPSIGGAGGSMQSTGSDLLRFVTALVDGTLLSSDSQAAMQAFVPGDDLSRFGIVHGYGLGIEQYASDAITVSGHMGTGQAQSAFLGYDAEHGTAVAVMTNTGIAGPQAIMAIEALTAVSQAG